MYKKKSLEIQATATIMAISFNFDMKLSFAIPF